MRFTIYSSRVRFLFFLFLFGGLIFTSCSPQNTLRGVFKKQSPYEKYQASLKAAKLDETALGQQWIAAGEQALQKAVPVSLPFKETGYFPADKPLAASYRFTVKQGQKVAVKVQTQGQQVPQVFIDLFEANPDNAGQPKQVSYADTTAQSLEYEIEEELPHVLRVQPELLRSGQYTVTIETLPQLAFPVQGKDSRAVQSFWGQDRDAGARRHEGIDIFAPRNTPVVAAVEGTVTRVNVTPIGGKVVWLSDAKRQQSLYYAHLDSQLVQPGQRVSIGDTLGLLGNTGNAITTAPHLHFGIYRFGQGAVDPFPYVHHDRTKPASLQADEKKLGNWVRTARSNANLRLAPAASATSLQTLSQYTPLQVLAGSGTWYRVMLPDGQQGYVASSMVETLDKPIQAVKLTREAPLLEASSSGAAPQKNLSADSTVRVLAKQDAYWLVKDPQGTTGWIPAEMAR
ncbi:peptidoglycan DD-metalloendopeptidase family protein [Rufibacter sediminis]|uniref:M23 family metallopeptidase n=1 Tax=Rufibacter sediminis TaxID=2762756 RepID=A0ABR6VWC6_9BACT|nr:M23 family metallopeptidase [Rufibacter sediminis]MBC3541454.1 M23 family metallopeptidase [Rufibacter sediminis]